MAEADLFIWRVVPGRIRSDDGPEFVAKSVQAWVKGLGAETATIAPGSLWESSYVESVNARLRDGLLDSERAGARTFEAFWQGVGSICKLFSL